MSLLSDRTSERDSRPVVGPLRAVGVILFFVLIGPPVGGIILFVFAISLGAPGSASFTAYLLLLFVFGSYLFGILPALSVGVIAAAWQYYKQAPRVALAPVILASLVFGALVLASAKLPPSMRSSSTRDVILFLGLNICAGVSCRLLVNRLLDFFDRRRTQASMP